jgi:hypothetical protein
MTRQRIKAAGNKVARAAKHAGKKVGETAIVVSDLNNDGKVDKEDAKIAAAKTKVFASKAADGAGKLIEKPEARRGSRMRQRAPALALWWQCSAGSRPAVGAAVGAVVGCRRTEDHGQVFATWYRPKRRRILGKSGADKRLTHLVDIEESGCWGGTANEERVGMSSSVFVPAWNLLRRRK